MSLQNEMMKLASDLRESSSWHERMDSYARSNSFPYEVVKELNGVHKRASFKKPRAPKYQGGMEVWEFYSHSGGLVVEANLTMGKGKAEISIVHNLKIDGTRYREVMGSSKANVGDDKSKVLALVARVVQDSKSYLRENLMNYETNWE